MNPKMTYQEILKLRLITKDTLWNIAHRTGLAASTIHNIERGNITEIKNAEKRRAFEDYLRNLQQRIERIMKERNQVS